MDSDVWVGPKLHFQIWLALIYIIVCLMKWWRTSRNPVMPMVWKPQQEVYPCHTQSNTLKATIYSRSLFIFQGGISCQRILNIFTAKNPKILASSASPAHWWRTSVSATFPPIPRNLLLRLSNHWHDWISWSPIIILRPKVSPYGTHLFLSKNIFWLNASEIGCII